MDKSLEALKEIINAPIVETVYKDLAQQSAQNVGVALGAITGLITTAMIPLRLLNARSEMLFRRNMVRFAERLDAAASEGICPAPAEIAVPILDRLAYIEDIELAEMFAGLLVGAATTSLQGKAHPSFIRIIDALTPDEAKILRHLYSQGWMATESIGLIDHGDGSPLPDIPLHNLCFCILPTLTCRDHEKQRIYQQNLQALSLISVSSHLPDSLRSDPAYRDIIEFHDEELKQRGLDHSAQIQRTTGKYHLSGLGLTFCSVVMKVT